jgi:hypothetical protein
VPALAATLTDTPLTGEPHPAPRPERQPARRVAEASIAWPRSPPTPSGPRRCASAVSILGVWAEPSPLDRVDGFYLAPFAAQPPTTPRDGTAAKAAVERLIASMPADATEGEGRAGRGGRQQRRRRRRR